MSAQPRGSADKKEHANDYPLTSRQTSSAILVLCNGQRKCKVEGCYKAAYQRGRCPSHGGQNQGRSQRCTNYSYSQSSCQTHGGKSHTNHRDTNCSTVESSSGGSKTDTPAPLAHQTVHDDSSHDKSSKANSNNHTSKSTNLQSNKKFSTAPTSDAWHSSDLSNRFRSASSKRTEKAVQSVKQENTSPQENPLVTKRRRTIVKATTNKCKVRTCKQNTVTNGFCHVHSKREICQHEDCSNLTPKNAVSGMCTRHGGHKKCEINGCVANAQYYGLCRKHGGSPICRERGCSRPAHSRGFCSAHFRVVQDQASDPLQPRSPSYTRLKTEEDGG
ncbi:hypothetical protein PHMEG_000338 [Phytophthora megakarya]|uniref:WRKY transcription factor 19 n=1 Tax=Phytophthora megakarya TaxID=4795 RepID=A0A225X5G5_9STRA|nr:hypothetical protein PHMEG_000338 [Phytophthora megakarya]